MTMPRIKVDQYVVDQATEKGFPSPNQYILDLIYRDGKNVAHSIEMHTQTIVKSHNALADMMSDQLAATNLLLKKLNLQLDVTDLERKFLDQIIQNYSDKNKG